MKTYSRILVLVLTIVMLICVAAPTYAASGDTVAPVIHSVTIEGHTANKTYTENNTLKVKIKASDNFQITYIYFTIRQNGDYENMLYELHRPDIADEYVIEVPLKYFNTGDYFFTGLEVWDSQYNQTAYEVDLNPYFYFSVNNSSYTTGVPRVNSMTVYPKSGNSQKTNFTYTINVSPVGDSGIKSVSGIVGRIIGTQQQSGCQFEFEPTGKKNEYSATICFKDRTHELYRTMEVLYITVETNDGKVYSMIPTDSKLTWIPDYIGNYKSKDLSVTLTDVVEDTDAPQLVSWKYLTETLYTPDIMKMQVTATDKTTEPVSVEVWMKKEGSDEIIAIPGGLKTISSGKTAVFEMSFEFRKYEFDGTIYISEMRIDDRMGNSTTYSVANGTLEKKIFEVVDGAVADYYTSTTDKNLLNIVSAAALEKGKIVCINITDKNRIIPKEVFEIIAGQDVTVIFEKMYDNAWSDSEADDGIEWVMYGKHVDKAKAKDINAYVKVVKESWRGLEAETEFKKPNGEKKDNFIRIVFANNGELPGKATIRFKPGFTLRSFTNANDMRLYYLNDETHKVDLIQSKIKTEKTGYFHFNITHNSSYAFVGEYAASDNSSSGNGANGNNGSSQVVDSTSSDLTTNTNTTESGVVENNGGEDSSMVIVIIIVVVVVFAAAGVFGFIFFKKKKAQTTPKTLADADPPTDPETIADTETPDSNLDQ